MSNIRGHLNDYLSARGTIASKQLNGTMPLRSEQERMTDGTVSQYDLTVAKRLRDSSKDTVETLRRTGASKEDVDAARKQFFAAERLYGAVEKQFKSQSTWTNIKERAHHGGGVDVDEAAAAAEHVGGR
jgi:hypothetical protein